MSIRIILSNLDETLLDPNNQIDTDAWGVGDTCGLICELSGLRSHDFYDDADKERWRLYKESVSNIKGVGGARNFSISVDARNTIYCWIGKPDKHGPRVKFSNIPGKFRSDDCFSIRADGTGIVDGDMKLKQKHVKAVQEWMIARHAGILFVHEAFANGIITDEMITEHLGL